MPNGVDVQSESAVGIRRSPRSLKQIYGDMHRTNGAVRRLSPIFRRLDSVSEEELRTILLRADLIGQELVLGRGQARVRLKSVAGQLAISQAALAREEAARREQIDAELPSRTDILRLLARELKVTSLEPLQPETDLFHIARKMSLCLDKCEGDSSTTSLVALYEAGVAALVDVAAVMDRIGAYTTGKPLALTISTGATSMDSVVRAPNGQWRPDGYRPPSWESVDPLSRSLFTEESLQKDFAIWQLSIRVKEVRARSGLPLSCNPYEFPEELYAGSSDGGYPPVSLLDWDDPNIRVAGALARSFGLEGSEQQLSSGAQFHRAIAAVHPGSRQLTPIHRLGLD